MLLISQVERELGKRDRGHWAPREIDVDLLAVGGCEVTRPGLTLPHPAIRERDFVLLPWRDIAPDWPLAGCDGQTISALSARLTGVSAQPLAECAA